MASRNFSNMQALSTGVKMIFGNFTVDGASAVATQVPEASYAFTVTKVVGPVGVYRITLADKYNSALSVTANIFSAAALNAGVQVQAVNAATGVIDLQVVTLSTGAALDPVNAGVQFVIAVRNTEVPR